MTQILVVDDSPTIRRMVKAALGALPPPIEFIEARQGSKRSSGSRSAWWISIVLDLNMPDMHGLEVLGFVRAHQKYRQLPIIVLTTRGDDQSRQAALQAGANAYLTKPFAPQGLAREAAALLATDRRARERLDDERLPRQLPGRLLRRVRRAPDGGPARPPRPRGIGRPDRPDPVVTEELFRSFHSLKGISGMVELRESELLAHEMESYLRAMREGDVRLTTSGVDALIEGARIARSGDRRPPERRACAERDRHAGRAAAAADRRACECRRSTRRSRSRAVGRSDGWECVFTPSAALIARGINVDVVRERLRKAGEVISGTPLVTEGGAVAFRFVFTGAPDQTTLDAWLADGMACSVLDAASAVTGGSEDAGDESPATAGPLRRCRRHYVRVDLARLDELMRMIGDLVISGRGWRDSLSRVEAACAARASGGSSRRTAGAHRTAAARPARRRDAGAARAGRRDLPAHAVRGARPRPRNGQARSSSRSRGQDTEIDKYPGRADDRSGPAPGAQRRQPRHRDAPRSASPPASRRRHADAERRQRRRHRHARDRRRRARRRRGSVIARARGERVSPCPDGPLDSDALLDLLCAPGFSTRDAADRVSGRGVGMAVVQHARCRSSAARCRWTPRPARARGSSSSCR